MHIQTVLTNEPKPGLMAAKDIVRELNISRAHLHSLVREHKFPAPAVRIPPRWTRWKSEDVKNWLNAPEAWIAANSKTVA